MLTVNLETIPIRPGDHVLDLGCGHGRHLHAIYDSFASGTAVNLVGADLNLDDVRKTREGFLMFPIEQADRRQVTLAVSNALALPFASERFDVIICSEVLEHIYDYKAALDEIERILKPGGQLAISVPRSWPEWICWQLSEDYRNEPGGHVRIFNAEQLRSDIEARGFDFKSRHWAHALHSPYWWLKCLFWKQRDDLWLIKLYHRMLVWDLIKRPWITRIAERIANPIMGKSIVLYFSKEARF